MLTALIGCAGAQRPAKVAEESSNTRPAASDVAPAAQLGSSREFQLIDGTLACMLSWREPALASASVTSVTGDQATPKGAAELEEADAAEMDAGGSVQCADAAHAMGLSPAELGAGEQPAIDRVRRVVRTLLSANDTAPDVSENMSALFDRGITAITSERTIRQALRQRRDIDITQLDSLGDLDHFARDMKLSVVGAEAQALAWILGARRFAEEPPAAGPNKIVAGEALVSAVLDAPGSRGKTSTPASWNQYVASAARSLRSGAARSGQAIGGGPPSSGDDDNVRAIVNAAKVRMRSLTTHLPEASAMREELTRAAAQLDAFTEGE
jgi:hypothetical protein